MKGPGPIGTVLGCERGLVIVRWSDGRHSVGRHDPGALVLAVAADENEEA